ncbi:MAG TPA: hypothetical protein VF881_19575 [Polyangiaceae bacterium]
MNARILRGTAAALVVTAASRVIQASPQLSAGVTAGAAGKGDRSQLWTSTELTFGLRSELLLGRARNADLGVGPYAEVLTTSGFSDLQVGAGLTWLLPVHPDLPLLMSAGGYLGDSPTWGWEPGLAGELFWGSHSYNYHSFYALDAGLFAGGRYALGPSRDVTVLVGLRLDLELIALPFLLAWGAFRGGDPAR